MLTLSFANRKRPAPINKFKYQYVESQETIVKASAIGIIARQARVGILMTGSLRQYLSVPGLEVGQSEE